MRKLYNITKKAIGNLMFIVTGLPFVIVGYLLSITYIHIKVSLKVGHDCADLSYNNYIKRVISDT